MPSPPFRTGAGRQGIRRLRQGAPAELNYGSPGIGGPHHLAMELFKRTTGIEITHVPYRGSAGAAQDIVGGHVAGGTPEELAAFIARDITLWQRVVKEAGIAAQ